MDCGTDMIEMVMCSTICSRIYTIWEFLELPGTVQIGQGCTCKTVGSQNHDSGEVWIMHSRTGREILMFVQVHAS